MADKVTKVAYCYVTVPNRPGQGAQLLGLLKEAGVNLLAYTGFPTSTGAAQLDFVVETTGALRRVARRHGWRLSPPKRGLLIQGADRPGAAHRHLAKLAAAKINVVAADAVTAGGGRYGMILWVKQRDFPRAARTLAAR